MSAAPECKGAFVRYRESAFISGRSVKRTSELRELKRMSCDGCAQCDSIWETIFESGADSVEIDAALQNGDVARLSITVDSTDWETGHADDWHVVATRVPL